MGLWSRGLSTSRFPATVSLGCDLNVEGGRETREGNLNAERAGVGRTMPHFTVTKVEDPEEGAASPGPTSAEVKAWIQDPQEPGESRACSFGDPHTSFREGSGSFGAVVYGCQWRKGMFFNCLTPGVSDNSPPSPSGLVFPTKSFLCPLPTGEIESVALYEKSFQAKRKTQ